MEENLAVKVAQFWKNYSITGCISYIRVHQGVELSDA
jgi:hypothetical protein